MKLVHVQSVLPDIVTVALMSGTGTTSIKDAIIKAVYHYLKCENIDAKEKKSD